MKTDSKRSVASPCKVCRGPTSDGKPFCIDHIDRLPQSTAVQAKILAREEELRAIRRHGAKAVDIAGECAREAVAVLKAGPLTIKRFVTAIDMPAGVAEALIAALESAGRVRRIDLTVKGKTQKALALPGEGLAEAS